MLSAMIASYFAAKLGVDTYDVNLGTYTIYAYWKTENPGNIHVCFILSTYAAMNMQMYVNRTLYSKAIADNACLWQNIKKREICTPAYSRRYSLGYHRLFKKTVDVTHPPLSRAIMNS